MRLAFIIQRYGQEIVGGAEYFTRIVAEHLSPYHTIEILTTCAKGYHTWENEYPEISENIGGVQVRRFKNSKFRDMNTHMRIQETVFFQNHSLNQEEEWIDKQGPFCPNLIEYIKNHTNDYDIFIFFTYRYYPSYYGIPEVKNKSVIVPFAENDPALHLVKTSELFNQVQGIIFSTPEERKLIRNNVNFNENGKEFDVIGCGIDLPSEEHNPKKSQYGDYIFYLGRIEGSKGCYQLFEFYQRFISEWTDAPNLVLAGFDAIGIPKNDKIFFIGYVSEEEKRRLLKNAKLLIMPSPFESFSIVTLEAMACGTPVLVNGECEVLKGHCIRSNAGLWYQNYDEFKEGLNLLLSDVNIYSIMKRNGIRYIKENYAWNTVIQKYLNFFEKIHTISAKSG